MTDLAIALFGAYRPARASAAANIAIEPPTPIPYSVPIKKNIIATPVVNRIYLQASSLPYETITLFPGR